ncbi:MAG: SCO family protein [Bacteroidales bacterium]|nr:SCO family protein [Bacteroidales bacterium]
MASAYLEQELKVGIEEHLDSIVPPDIMLLGEDNRVVALKDVVDKPTILSLVYYRCPGICSPLMEGIASVVDRSDMALCKDYQVVTISFDPREGIELGKRKKINYVNLMDDTTGTAVGWKFFVSDSANIGRLTQAVGFKYQKEGNEFSHSASLIFISPEGKITRYLNGTTFLPFELKMAVIESSEGKSGPTINKVLQYCYSYNRDNGQYILNITRVAGAFYMFL